MHFYFFYVNAPNVCHLRWEAEEARKKLAAVSRPNRNAARNFNLAPSVSPRRLPPARPFAFGCADPEKRELLDSHLGEEDEPTHNAASEEAKFIPTLFKTI